MLPTQTQIKQLIAHLNATTQREVIRISLSLADNLALTDSKFGGLPYIPQGGSLPTSVEGKPLFMLAQINCEQLPENNLYPQKGLLQFWIAPTTDYLYGLDLNNPCSNDNKRVLYYPTITEALPIEAFVENYTFEDRYLPFSANLQFALHFSKDTETFSLDEGWAKRLFIEKWNETFSDNIKDMWNLPEEICQIIDSLLLKNTMRHKIGGYPYFTQVDRREENDPHTLLLLQIDSDEIDNAEIMWGDCGVANFFITPKDLASCKFDEVLYNWDCS